MNKQTAQAALLVLLCVAASCVPGRPAVQADELRREEEVTSFAGIGSQLVLAAARRYPKSVEATTPPPVALTTSDGTGLSLVSYQARAVIDGPLAFTELSLRFRNPRAERIEGRFAVSLPSGAAVSRLAMRIGGRWQEAEVVEKQKARQSYEAVLHRGFDPALLEKKAGNAFSARIFPIEANADKEIILSYSHDLEAGRYELPLAGLPLVQELDVDAQVRRNGAWKTVTMSERHVVPRRDFALTVPREREGLRHGNLVALRLRPTFDARPQPLRRVAVLFDTSASRALGFAREVRRLGALLTALGERHGGETYVELVAFDQEVSPVYAGTLEDVGEAVDEILARRPLGASDLHAAVAWLASRKSLDRAILITDAVATAGPAESTALLARL
ncbi:MAG: VIT and VWA domain-containing protein, partial [Polyangiaceae bacterium]